MLELIKLSCADLVPAMKSKLNAHVLPVVFCSKPLSNANFSEIGFHYPSAPSPFKNTESPLVFNLSKMWKF